MIERDPLLELKAENARLIALLESGNPALLRMWDKRRRGYTAMGYRIGE